MNELIGQIVFTGVVAFVSTVDSNTVAVTKAMFAQGATPPSGVPNHQVYLVVDTDRFTVQELSSGHRHESGTVISELGRKYTYFVLHNEEIEIANVKNTPFYTTPDSVTDPTVPASPEDYSSMHWVPKMEGVFPRWFWFGSYDGDPRGLREYDTHFMSVEVPLRSGRLSVTHVEGDVWQFQPAPMPHHHIAQALAQEVTLEVDLIPSMVVPATLVLEAREFGSAGLPDLFEIQRASGTSKEDPIQILLANVPENDLVPDASPAGDCAGNPLLCALGENDPCPAHCVDEHFQLYYSSVYASSPRLPPIPHRMRSNGLPFPTALRVGGANCPPTQYDDGVQP
jgi:hypothetical protein